MICGGAEAPVNPTGLGGFVACRALSSRNDEPSKASRPWDQGRDGFVLGEGAGVLVLESLESAMKVGGCLCCFSDSVECWFEFLHGFGRGLGWVVSVAHPCINSTRVKHHESEMAPATPLFLPRMTGGYLPPHAHRPLSG